MLHTSLRRLGRRPTFSLLAIATLAIGLTATGAILAVFDGVLVRPLPFPEPERLVTFRHAAPGLDLPRLGISGKLYLHYLEHAESFSAMGLVDQGEFSIGGLDRPIRIFGARFTPSVFGILGIEPLKGRTFTDDEGRPGREQVVVVSEAFWRERLGEVDDVLDRRLMVDGIDTQIVGVMPSRLSFPDERVEIWLPEVLDPEQERLGSFGRTALARLRPEADLQSAVADLSRFVDNLEGIFPDEGASAVLSQSGFSVDVVDLKEHIVGDQTEILWLLLGTAGFVFLLSGLNVANLFLARAEESQRESAIRAALGAGPGSLARSALVEGGLIAGAAGCLGILAARMSLPNFLAMAPTGLPRASEIVVDGRVGAVLVVLVVLSAVGLGMVPLLRLRLGDLAVQLKDGGRSSSAGRGRNRTRRALVAIQVAIASLLLVGAGLMVRSYDEITRVEPGFEIENGMSFQLSLPVERARTDTGISSFYTRVIERLESLPGVASAAATSTFPLSGEYSGSGHRLKSLVDQGKNELPFVFSQAVVSPGYFETAGIPIVRGRALKAADSENRTTAIVISQSIAEKYWPDEDPIGQMIFPGTPEEDQSWYEVVGVAGDVVVRSLTEGPDDVIYYPWLGPIENGWLPNAMTVLVRTSGDPGPLQKSMRAAVWEIDPGMPVAQEHTLEEVVERARANAAFTALMLLAAAVVALSLAAVGTYGVIAYLVTQRRTEFGVRMALGAERKDVLKLVLREGLVLACVGGTVGLAGGAALARVLESILFRVGALDPVVFSTGPILLLLVALAACAVPAHRAAGIPPTEALRSE